MSENLEFGWPDSFLDVWRHEGKDKVSFDGFVTLDESEIEIPAYEFGVQALWVLKVSSNVKGIFVSATVKNPGQYGNSVIIHIYLARDVEQISPDAYHELWGWELLRQMEYPYAVPVKIMFNGEGN
ncbi:hypothetical protein ES702_00747 [subsurface metagenome]